MPRELPPDYIARKRAEGTTDPELWARWLAELRRAADAHAIADAAMADEEAELRERAEEFAHRAARVRARREESARNAAEGGWWARTILGILAREGTAFAPGVKTAHLGTADLLLRDVKAAIEIHDRAGLKALTPDALKTGTAWHEPTARALLVPTEEGTLCVAGTGECVPPEVASYRPGGPVYTLRAGGLEFVLPAWADDTTWPEELAEEEEEDATD